MPFRRLPGLLLFLFLGACDGPPPIDCTLIKIAEIPMEVQDNLLVVRIGINRRWADLVVDTGAERTTLSEKAVRRLGMSRANHISNSVGIGGVTSETDVAVDRLDMGGVHFPLDIVPRFAVGSFDLHTERTLQADGLLGADILLAYEMDIDVQAGKLTLYRSRVCPTAYPSWQEPWIEIPGVRARKDRLLVPFELDNVQGLALLDTGAMHNDLGVNMARRMGLTDQSLANDPKVQQHGTGPEVVTARMHRFQLMRIGPIGVLSPRMTVLPSDFGVGDALLGEEFLLGRRVWLSFRKSPRIFVSTRPGD